MASECQSGTGRDPAEVLGDVQRLLHELAEHHGVEQARPAYLQPVAASAQPSPATARVQPAASLQLPTISQVRHMIQQREVRESFFEPGLVSDPVWGILLDLLLAHLEERHASIKEISIAARVPSATALRHIDRLEQRGLLHRYPDPFDKRRTYLALTDAALMSVAKLFARLRETALSAVA